MFFTCQSLYWTSLKKTPPRIAGDKIRSVYFLFVFHNLCWGVLYSVLCDLHPGTLGDDTAVFAAEGKKHGTDSWIFYLEVSDGPMLSFHWLKQVMWFCLCSVDKKGQSVQSRYSESLCILSTMLSSLFSWAASYCSSNFHRSQPSAFCLVHPQGWLILFSSHYQSQMQ